MEKPLFRRCLVFASLGVASLALTACGGGSNGDVTVAVETPTKAVALGTTDNADPQRPGDEVAADVGAASQEPK